MRRLLNRCRANNESHSWELYREAKRRYRKEVRKASKETWRTSCSFVQDLPRSARLHRASQFRNGYCTVCGHKKRFDQLFGFCGLKGELHLKFTVKFKQFIAQK